MILLLLYPILFSTGIFVNKLLLGTLSPTLLTGTRMLISGLIIIVANWQSYKNGALAHIREHWKTFVIITLFTTLAPSLLKAYAIKYLTTAKVGFLGSIDPFVAALYAYFLFGERLTVYKWLGIFLGLIGAIILTLAKTPLEQALGSIGIFSVAELTLLSSLAIGKLGWILTQKEIRQSKLTPFDINGVVMTGSGIIALTGIPLIDGSYMAAWQNITALTPNQIGLLCYTIVFGNLLAYNIYTYLLKHHSATLMSIVGLSIPVFLTSLGYTFLGEELTKLHIIGAVFLIIGPLVFSYKPKQSA